MYVIWSILVDLKLMPTKYIYIAELTHLLVHADNNDITCTYTTNILLLLDS